MLNKIWVINNKCRYLKNRYRLQLRLHK
jgi:hypothetical protein